MVQPARRSDFSYRADPNVPDFDDAGPIVVMDGECVLCSVGARLIARFDKKAEFAICRSQTPTGRALLIHYGLDPDDPATWIYLERGRAFGSLDAMIRAGRRVGGVGWLLQPLRLLPRRIADWLYARIARNRYRMFGRTDFCTLPDQRLRSRLME